MAAKIYRDKDASLKPLTNKTCAILGFGSQGRAHALNLKDSGIRVIIGLRKQSRFRALARADKLPVLEIPAAVSQADVIFLALPDTKMADIFRLKIAGHLRKDQALLFAHGFAILYRSIVPPKNVDVLMVAPLGLGPMVRREFLEGRGVPALLAIEQNSSGRAREIALAWAKGIGATRAGAIFTTFREETETDLFSEQAVLCGGMSALVRAGFETLVKAGYAPEVAYYECLHELKFIVDLMHEAGLAGMEALISETAKWGSVTVGPKIVGDEAKREMTAALQRIQSGRFAREWTDETNADQRRLKSLLREAAGHQIENVGRRLRRAMTWKPTSKK